LTSPAPSNENCPEDCLSTQVEVSVVIPVCDEADNVAPLAAEIAAALAGRDYEILFVDDGSSDGTGERVLGLAAAGIAPLRLLRHSRRAGQSAALCTGVRHARGEHIVTLDGDGQNDPADIPRLLAAQAQAGDDRPVLVIGHRQGRRDTAWRRLQSRIANGVRSRLLGDGAPDTGCGLKAFDRALFLEMPCFDHMHRFLPALMRRAGGEVVSVPVGHRERRHGRSKYGMLDRLWVGIVDLYGVMWLAHRGWARLEVQELTGAAQ